MGTTQSKGAAAALAGITALLYAKPDALDQVKMVGVLRYVATFTRELILQDVDPVNPVKSFFSECLPAAQTKPLMFRLLILSLLRVFFLNRSTSFTLLLSKITYAGDRQGFKQLLPQSLLTVVGLALVSSWMDYTQDSLAIAWRTRITEIIQDLYFQAMNYYHIANIKKPVHDPDERLTREVWSISQRMASLVVYLIKALPSILWFTIKLYRSRGLPFAMLPHIYLLLAYEIAQRLFPKNIGDLYRAKAINQAMFFGSVGRVHTHSEAIAALDGSKTEKAIVKYLFGKVRSATEDLHLALSKFGLTFKLAYTYGCRSWISSFLMFPFVQGSGPRSENDVRDIVGQIDFSRRVMLDMLIANGQLLTMHAQAEHMYGMCKRLYNVIDKLRNLEKRALAENHVEDDEKISITEVPDEIRFEGVNIITPAGVELVEDLSFALKQGGDSLLITGQNGAGKSSIFRVLGGLWETPCGTITKPSMNGKGLHDTVYYLPQKPYNVLGTLRDQLTYPEKSNLNPQEMKDLLRRVNLEYLLDGYDIDEDFVNWGERLSLGEQQRLAMARLFFHQPKFAILDECTSAVTNEMERLLYAECIERGISYITICHRPALREFHDRNLHLVGDKTYVVQDIDRDRYKSKASRKVTVSGSQNEVKSGVYDYMKELKTFKPTPSISRLRSLLNVMITGSGKKLGTLMGVILLRTLLHEGYSFIVGKLMLTAIVDRNMGKFVVLSGLNFCVDMVTGVVEESVIYLQNLVSAAWSTNLEKHAINKYFQKNSFYNLQNIDKRVVDADQRVTQEIQDLSDHYSSIWGMAITPVVDVCWFSFRLLSVLKWNDVSHLYAYVLASWIALKILRPDIESLKSAEKNLESRFKFVHTRVKNHSESIAFFGGDFREKQIATKAYNELEEKMINVRASEAMHEFVFRTLNKDYEDSADSLSLPILVSMDVQIGAANSMSNSGKLERNFKLGSYTERTIRGFGKLGNLMEHVTKLLASASRVCDMFEIIDELDEESKEAQFLPSDDSIEFRNVDIVTPDGRCLAGEVNVVVKKPESLMVTGYNGVGKTSFFRVLSGLWQAQNGTIHRPLGRGSVYLVPQKAYSVSGTLADQVTYPQKADLKKDTEAMMDALKRVGIDYLVERVGGWKTIKRWEHTLSLGEQQRMGLARVFFHKPDFCVLDECTDAVSADVERELYETLHELGITCITISKRLGLEEYHHQNLQFGTPNEMGWSLSLLHQE